MRPAMPILLGIGGRIVKKKQKGWKSQSDTELAKESLDKFGEVMKSHLEKQRHRATNPSPSQIKSLDKYHKFLDSKD